MLSVPTCAICSSTQIVQSVFQTLHQTKPSRNKFFAQCWIATEQYFLDAATKWAGKHLVFPNSFYEEEWISNKDTILQTQFIQLTQVFKNVHSPVFIELLLAVEWFRILLICCNTMGNPQIPSEWGTLRSTITPGEADRDKHKTPFALIPITMSKLILPDRNLGFIPRPSRLLLSLRSAVSSSCRDVFQNWQWQHARSKAAMAAGLSSSSNV